MELLGFLFFLKEQGGLIANPICVNSYELPSNTVEPLYSGHPWDTTKWLLYGGGLLIEMYLRAHEASHVREHMAMASQIVGEGSCYEWSSYVRGYHVYQTVWTPAVGETLRLAVEPTNSYDIYAVALIQDG